MPGWQPEALYIYNTVNMPITLFILPSLLHTLPKLHINFLYQYLAAVA